MSAINFDEPYVDVRLSKQMTGVPEGTGIPGLDELKAAAEPLGFALTAFESHTPGDGAPPVRYEEHHRLLLALKKAVEAEIEGLEFADEPEEFVMDFELGDAWDAWVRLVEER